MVSTALFCAVLAGTVNGLGWLGWVGWDGVGWGEVRWGGLGGMAWSGVGWAGLGWWSLASPPSLPLPADPLYLLIPLHLLIPSTCRFHSTRLPLP